MKASKLLAPLFALLLPAVATVAGASTGAKGTDPVVMVNGSETESQNLALYHPDDIISQNRVEGKIRDTIYVKAKDFTEMFNGYLRRLNTYVQSHIVYPEEARRQGLYGVPTIGYTLTEEGRMEDVAVLKSCGHPSLDAEALRVVKSYPERRPLMNDGTPVRSTITVPVVMAP